MRKQKYKHAKLYIKKESVGMLRKDMFGEVKFSFVLIFDQLKEKDLLEEAKLEMKPKETVLLNKLEILVLESERKVMVNPGVDIPKKFAKFVKLMVITPEPDFGCLDGRQNVGYGVLFDDKFNQLLSESSDILIREYYIFELNLDPELDEAFWAIFVPIIGFRTKNNRGTEVFVGNKISQIIVEVVDIEEANLPNNYSLRCPFFKSDCLIDTRKFDNKIIKLLKEN